MSTPTLSGHGLPPKQDDSSGRRRAKLAVIAGGSAVLIILFIAILLPGLDAARRDARMQKNTHQVRGIVQGSFTTSNRFESWLAGTTRQGFLVADVDGADADWMPATKHSATVEGRYWLMLDSNLFGSEVLISPCESKTPWTTGELSEDHYSYALVNIHSRSDALPGDQTVPDQGDRANAWRTPVGNKAALVADRARIPGGRIGQNYDKIYSVHTTAESENWVGSVGLGDGSASFLNNSMMDTQYGSGPTIQADRLFAIDPDASANIDVIRGNSTRWDTKSNALLGYTSIGYEDGDIASE